MRLKPAKKPWDEWTFKGRRYRLCRVRRYVRDPRDPFEPPQEHQYNVIQVRRWGVFWKTLEEERIPGYALISLACVGDTGDFHSSLFETARTKFGMPA